MERIAGFVNDERGPIKKSGFHSFYLIGNKLYGTRTYYYDHPEAPGQAFVPVQVSEEIVDAAKHPGTGIGGLLKLFGHAIESLQLIPQVNEMDREEKCWDPHAE